MRLSCNKIIKVQRPIKNVVVLNSHSPEVEAIESAFTDGMKMQPQVKEIRIPETQYHEELQAAFEKGLEEGKHQGYQETEIEYKSRFENMASVFQNLENEQARIVNQAENSLLELAIKMVERIVLDVPELFPKLIDKSVENVLQYLSNEPLIDLYLNPKDLEDIDTLQEKFEKSLPGLEKISIKKDPRITRGGCLVETGNGKIDARLETMITKLTSGVRKELKSLTVREN